MGPAPRARPPVEAGAPQSAGGRPSRGGSRGQCFPRETEAPPAPGAGGVCGARRGSVRARPPSQALGLRLALRVRNLSLLWGEGVRVWLRGPWEGASYSSRLLSRFGSEVYVAEKSGPEFEVPHFEIFWPMSPARIRLLCYRMSDLVGVAQLPFP